MLPEPGEGVEAAALGRWEEPVAIPVIPPEPAEPELEPVDLLAEPEERAALEPEVSAASVAEELARATAALLAEIGEEPAVVEPLEPVAEESGDEGLEVLPWAGPAGAVPERSGR